MRILAVASAVVFLAWSPVRATADGPDFWAASGVPAGGTLTVRASPWSTSEELGAIPRDARRIQNLGCRGEGRGRWCRVRYRGVQGWVAGRFLREDAAAAAPSR